MKKIIQSTLFFLPMVYSIPAFADSYSCGNRDMEVRCDGDKCEKSDTHTPMGGGVDTFTKEVSICAYSACWQGKGEILSSDKNFVIAYAENLKPNNAGAGPATIVFVINPETLGATLNGFGFQNPMTCNVEK